MLTLIRRLFPLTSCIAASMLAGICLADAPTLRLPARRPDALSGSAFAKSIESLPLERREDRIWQEVIHGNVPSFLRKLVPVPVTAIFAGRTLTGCVFVTPDYLAVGSDSDYFFVPLTPFTAQRIADRLGFLLPTPKIVDDVYAAAAVKLPPSPIPPSSAMTSVTTFEQHNATVGEQRQALLAQYPLGALVAGDKKDLVICKALADTPGHVAIYGWHKPDGKPIQPLYLGHFAYWADYSHGVRLVADTMEVEGKPMPIAGVLADPAIAPLISGEGTLAVSRYRFEAFPQPDDPTIHLPVDERIVTLAPMPGVRVMIDEPTVLHKKVRLVLFALPNGNTIEQTFGRRMKPGDDWHYDIQHIGAQTRFVRSRVQDESLVVAYLEASNHAWPAWIRSAEPGAALNIYETVVSRFRDHDLRVVLDSHSGGGAFELAYLKAVNRIPPEIDRIAFLDSEYNYDEAVHEAKLAKWLQGYEHYLCVIAYDDASARYQGKPFVSAEGGTWGRSHAMLADLGKDFAIPRANEKDPERYEGLSGRLVFLLKENPHAEILHTVQVERNGFIESLLSGTTMDGIGYEYFGQRAYSRLILP